MPDLISHITANQWIILMIVGLCIGMSKTGISGLGLMVVPLLAAAFGARESTGILMPILIIADVYAVVYYHRMAVWSHIIRLMPWAVAGILAGVYAGKAVSADQFRVLMLVLVITGLGIMVYRDLIRKSDEIPENRYFAALMGVLGGFASMVGNTAGPMFAVYLLAMRLPKNHFIGTGAWFFLIINVVKLPFHAWSWKTIHADTLLLDLTALPMVLAGAWLGIRIVRRFPDGAYRIFVIAMTLVSALFMLIR